MAFDDGSWAAAAIEPPRLDLEPLRADHAEEMVAVLSDPALHAFTGGAPPELEELRDRYRRQARGRSPDGSEVWCNWIARRRSDGAPVGTVQATVHSPGGTVGADGAGGGAVADLAWVIGRRHQGRGYAQEAAQGMSAWLASQGVPSWRALVHPEHHASIAVARSIGMHPTRTVLDGETVWERRA